MVRNEGAYARALKSQSLRSLGFSLEKHSILCNQFLIRRRAARRKGPADQAELSPLHEDLLLPPSSL